MRKTYALKSIEYIQSQIEQCEAELEMLRIIGADVHAKRECNQRLRQLEGKLTNMLPTGYKIGKENK